MAQRNEVFAKVNQKSMEVIIQVALNQSICQIIKNFVANHAP